MHQGRAGCSQPPPIVLFIIIIALTITKVFVSSIPFVIWINILRNDVEVKHENQLKFEIEMKSG